MNKLRLVFFSLALCAIVAVCGHSEGDTPPRLFDSSVKEMVSRSVPVPPKLDGRLNDPAWQSSDIAAEFTTLKNTVPHNTTVWVTCHDKNFIYFGFLCRDDRIVAQPRKHDQTGPDDAVEIQLVTDGRLGTDHRFRVNAKGSRLEATYNSLAWKPKPDWRVAVRSTGTGWIAEFALPFPSLTRVSIGVHSVWHIRIRRVDIGAEGTKEVSSWASFEVPEILSSELYGRLCFDSRKSRGTQPRGRGSQ